MVVCCAKIFLRIHHISHLFHILSSLSLSFFAIPFRGLCMGRVRYQIHIPTESLLEKLKFKLALEWSGTSEFASKVIVEIEKVVFAASSEIKKDKDEAWNSKIWEVMWELNTQLCFPARSLMQSKENMNKLGEESFFFAFWNFNFTVSWVYKLSNFMSTTKSFCVCETSSRRRRFAFAWLTIAMHVTWNVKQNFMWKMNFLCDYESQKSSSRARAF